MTTTESTSTTTPNPIAASSSTATVAAASSTSNGTTNAVKPASVDTSTAVKPVSAVPTAQKLNLPATLLPSSATTTSATTNSTTVTSNLKTVTAAPSTTATTAVVTGKVPSPILTRVPCPVAAPSASSKVGVVANTATSTATAKTAAPLKPASQTVKTTLTTTDPKPVATNTVSRPVAMTTTTATATATVPTRTSTISIAAPSTIRVQVPNPVSAPVTTTTTSTAAAAAPVPTPVPVQIPTSIGQGQVPTPVTIAPNAVGNTATAIVAPSTTFNKIASTITHVTHHPAKPTPVHSAPTSTTTTTTATTHMATATVKTVPVAQPIHVNKSMTTRKMNQRHVTNTTNTTVSPVPSSTTSTRSSKSSPKKKKHKIPMPTTSGGSSNTSASENTGRWTTEEHRLFLQGLEQHGKGWKKIASLIQSRTVVQIRTHAQKYFQKMAKARQNGETTEETVVSHGGNHIVSHSIRHGSKRKKNGNKRKAIASVVHSAVKERKIKKKRTAAASTVTSSTAEPVAAPVEPQIQSNAEPEGFPVSMVSTVLVPYTYPPIEHDEIGTVVTAETTVPSITTAHGTISGAALEESLFRFLTPMPNDYVNDVARQAGANSITLPSGNPNKTALDGEVSPSGVVDFPSDWAWSTEPPSWYAKGADVDELLNEADALDWLADTGDLQEAYTPPDSTKMTSEPSLMSLVENPSTASVVATSANEANNEPMLKEHVAIKTEEVAAPIPVLETSNNMASIASNGNMPLLPSMFDSDNHLAGLKKESSVNERLASSASLFAAASEDADAVVDADNFKLLDDHFEDEQAFVTALLDHPNDSSANLNHLGAGDNNHQ